jgi:tRNA(Ile)-lysidine synthase
MLLDFSLIDAGHQEVIELVAEKEVTKGEWVVGRQKSGQVYLDYDRLTLPLKIRRIHPGDRMRPFGMEGTKKLKAIFIDKKVAHGDRHRLPLLVDANGILWIVGACLNESVRITVGTRRVLKVVYDQVSEKSIEIRERLL